MDILTFIIIVVVGYIAFNLLRGFMNPSKMSKDEIKKVLKRNFKKFDGLGYDQTTVYAHALAETLKSWCRFRNKSYIDEKVEIEVLPFVLMNPQKSVDIFAEYLTFRDGTHEYDRQKLESAINKVVQNEIQKNSTYFQNLRGHKDLNFKWFQLLKPNVKEKLFNT